MSQEDPASVFAAATESPEPGAKSFHARVSLADAGVDLKDHSAEIDAVRSAEEGMGIHVPDKPERETIPIQNPALLVDPTAEMKNLVDAAFRHEFDFGKVTVESHERDRFVRCALHDSAMWFNIVLEGVSAEIKVVIPPEFFTTMAANAVTEWGKQGHLDVSSNLQWYLAFQQLHAWYQVRSINNEPTKWASVFEDEITSSAIRKMAYDTSNFEVFFNMSPVKWRMLVEAMRLAEAKYKICLEAWRDRSFFTSADTA